jgi:hypothetical protein
MPAGKTLDITASSGREHQGAEDHLRSQTVEEVRLSAADLILTNGRSSRRDERPGIGVAVERTYPRSAMTPSWASSGVGNEIVPEAEPSSGADRLAQSSAVLRVDCAPGADHRLPPMDGFNHEGA